MCGSSSIHTGIARVEAHAHDVRADGLDHHLHLARLQIAAVVLDGELDAGIDDPRAHPADRLDHVVDVHLDLRPLGVAAEDAAHARGAEDLRRPQRPRDLLLERPVLRVERARARADGTVRQLQLDAEASACAFTCLTAASSSSIGGGSEIIAHVSLIELKWSRNCAGVKLLPPTLPSIDPSSTLAAVGHADNRDACRAAAAVPRMKWRRSTTGMSTPN